MGKVDLVMVYVVTAAILLSFACGCILGYVLGYDHGFEVGSEYDDFDCGYHVGYTDAKNKYDTSEK